MKDILLILLSIVVLILLIMLIVFNQKVGKDNKRFEEEKYSRMVAEESLQKNAAKLATLEAQLKSANSKMSKVEELIEQQKGVNEDLKKEYEKLNKTKTELEDQLQTALKEKLNQATTTVPVQIVNQESVEVAK